MSRLIARWFAALDGPHCSVLDDNASPEGLRRCGSRLHARMCSTSLHEPCELSHQPCELLSALVKYFQTKELTALPPWEQCLPQG